MLVYILLIILLLNAIQYNDYRTKKELFKVTGCKARHKAISRYPKDGHIDPLFDAKFKPKCCPSPYSTSSGCLCRGINHSELIVMRGGNRIMC